MTTYRIRISADVEVEASTPLSREALVQIGREIGAGNRPWTWAPEGIDVTARPLSPTDEHIDVWIESAPCACRMPRESAVHGATEDCAGCPDPGEHHEYVSPGWEAPVDGVLPPVAIP